MMEKAAFIIIKVITLLLVDFFMVLRQVLSGLVRYGL
jgi:hypothetical protein